jgi:predicted DNA-binding transcriptional regulator YafY
MRHTANETSTQTLTRLITALDKQQPVTITYTKADGSETIRTIEIYNVIVSQAGDILVRAMDRETGESRSFRVDRIQAYTIHRTAYVLEIPSTDTIADTIATEDTEPLRLADTIAPHADHLTTTARRNNLAAAFAA